MNLTIKDYFYKQKKVYNILPDYYIDFTCDIYRAKCEYKGHIFESYLKPHEIKHIDTDYLYFEVAILLTQKLNNYINICVKNNI